MAQEIIVFRSLIYHQTTRNVKEKGAKPTLLRLKHLGAAKKKAGVCRPFVKQLPYNLPSKHGTECYDVLGNPGVVIVVSNGVGILTDQGHVLVDGVVNAAGNSLVGLLGARTKD